MTQHVVLIHRYFSPDTPPYANILKDIACHLGESGFRVTVLTCQPSYNLAVARRAPARERIAPQVEVIRWPVLDDRSSSLRKVFNLAMFCARLVRQVPRLGTVDAIMAASTPPVAVAAVTASLAKRLGAGFVYHKQDIYPEVTLTRGASRTGALARALRAVDSRTDRAASRVVVLSADMASTIGRRGVPADRIAVINNFDPWHLDDAVSGSGTTLDRRTRDRSPDQMLEVVFAGNIGRFQNLECLFAAIVQLRDDPLRFHFFGDGALAGDLQEMVRSEALENVKLYGYRNPEEVAGFLRSGLTWVSCRLAQESFGRRTQARQCHTCDMELRCSRWSKVTVSLARWSGHIGLVC